MMNFLKAQVTQDDDFSKASEFTDNEVAAFRMQRNVSCAASPPSNHEDKTKWKEDFLHTCLKYTYAHPIMRFS